MGLTLMQVRVNIVLLFSSHCACIASEPITLGLSVLAARWRRVVPSSSIGAATAPGDQDDSRTDSRLRVCVRTERLTRRKTSQTSHQRA